MNTSLPSLVSTDIDVRRAHSRDVSGLELVPESVARPHSVADIAELLQHASGTGGTITAAGLQSSTTGASLTDRGMLMSLAGMDRILDIDTVKRTIRVEPGARIADMRRAAEGAGLLFTPDPTSEEESTIGGAIACNASGARSFRYGATGAHVRALTVLLANGEKLEIARPTLEKNTVGYPIIHDQVDWFVGSEGTLGVVVEAELALHTLPAYVTGLAIPFASEADALAFIIAARESHTVAPRCLEYFGARAIAVVREHDARAGLGSDVAAMVYTEDAGDNEAHKDAALDAWLALSEQFRAITGDIRVFEGESALQDARKLRHAVPSHMNELGAKYRSQGGRKVSTDWAVPYRLLARALEMSNAIASAAGLEEAVTYGHAGNGHPHQNFVARDADELAVLEGVLVETLTRVVAMGGTVAAEHGIGKLKAKWLPLQLSATQLAVMKSLKQTLDPSGVLAPGNVF